MPTKEEISTAVTQACGMLAMFLEENTEDSDIIIVLAPSENLSDIASASTAGARTSLSIVQRFVSCEHDTSRIDEGPPKLPEPSIPLLPGFEPETQIVEVVQKGPINLPEEMFSGVNVSEIAAQASERLTLLFEQNGLNVVCFVGIAPLAYADSDLCTGACTGDFYQTNKMLAQFVKGIRHDINCLPSRNTEYA